MAVAALSVTGSAHAAGYNGSDLIDNNVFLNSNSMNAGDIQNFLNGEGGGLASQTFATPSNGNQSAAWIIANTAQDVGINPQTIIATLQKEQSLITQPSPTQGAYDFAMGYGCYDSTGCSQYSGFYNQVHGGSWQLRFNYERANGNTGTWTAPDGSVWGSGISYPCANGSSYYSPGLYPGNSVTFYDDHGTPYTTITLANAATASLYCYTPHAYPGSSAEYYSGSYNFVISFDSWFGSTLDPFEVIKSADNPTQYVDEDGMKLTIPSAAIATAYGLQNFPLTVMTDAAINAIPFRSTAPLSNLARIDGSLNVFLIDNGAKHYIPSASTYAAWGFDPNTISNIGVGLGNFVTPSTQLGYAVRSPNSGNQTIYMVDGGTLRPYSSPDVLLAWEGTDTTVLSPSTALFNTLGSVGSTLTSTKITDGTNQYQVDAGQKLLASTTISSLYPGSAQSVSTATLNRLVTSAPASQFIRDPGAPTVYMVDGGTLHTVASQGQLNAWSPGSQPSINLVDGSSVNLIPGGSPLTGYIASNSSQYYLMSGQLLPIPSSLQAGYTASSGGTFAASSALLSLFSTGPNATGFLKSVDSPSVYLLDNGLIRHIPSATDFTLWNGTRNESLMTLPDYLLGQFSTGSDATPYVTDGTLNYQFDNGTYYTVSSTQQSNWGLSNPILIAGSTLSRFTSGGSLAGSAQVGSTYYLVRNGGTFPTIDPNVATIWQINSSQAHSATLMSTLPAIGPLQRYFRSTDSTDNRMFLRDGSNIFQLASPSQVYNFGFYGGSPIPQLTPTEIGSLTQAGMAQTIMVSTSYSGVADNGVFRNFADTPTAQLWESSSPNNTMSVSNALVATLPTGPNVSRLIKGSGPAVYVMQSGQKSWIASPTTLQQSFGAYPVTNISDLLLGLIPSGANY